MREYLNHLLKNQAAGGNVAPQPHPVDAEEVLFKVNSSSERLETAVKPLKSSALLPDPVLHVKTEHSSRKS